ncbi:flagellar protein FliO/FliZ [Massilia sp. UYP11]|uniref:flagellar biosynthetic protein FliO n=1 Tax=Massilia sp. UYP11 TaxID=1756385 RepID=UPI003D191FA6
MTPRRAPALFFDRTPVTGYAGAGSAAKLPTLRSIAAALLFAPLVACAQQAANTDTTSTPAPPAGMAGASSAPAQAPAAHEDAVTPRRPGDTTQPVATAPVSPASTAPLSEAPRVALPPSTMPAPSSASPGAGRPDAGRPDAGGLLKTIMALTLVLGLLAGLAWMMKRYGPKMGGGNANLRVVGALNLGGRERIMVVEVGDQWIVVGAAPGRVNALHTMPRQEGELTPAAAHGGIPATNFSDWLKKTIDKRNAR